MKIMNVNASTLALGATSVLALVASTGQSLAQEGLYMGFSVGSTNGDNPSPGDSDTEYQMNGASLNAFIGIQRDMGNGMFGGVELAYTGPTEGDANDDSSYEYAYDTNYTIDAKARIGKNFGKVSVYGFGGLSTGSVNNCCYGADYNFYGVNVGAGAQFDVTDKMFAGVEYIHRFTQGTFDSDDGYGSDHGTLSLRVGYSF